MSKILNRFIFLAQQKIRLFLGISFGIFLFVLFFQPFPLDVFDFNNRLLFVAGLGAIVFLFMVLVRIGFQMIFQDGQSSRHEPVLPYYLGGLIMWALSSVAMAFYLNYVGSVSISMYIMFKIILICLAPPVILRLNDSFGVLHQKNKRLIIEQAELKKQLKQSEDDSMNITVDFRSESGSESIQLLANDITLIRSADNYVQILFREGEGYQKKLIRNTLKNIEQQLTPYDSFIRCHRTCIVNSRFVEKLHTKSNNLFLLIRGMEEKIPVSRQYLLKLKEAL